MVGTSGRAGDALAAHQIKDRLQGRRRTSPATSVAPNAYRHDQLIQPVIEGRNRQDMRMMSSGVAR